MYHPYYNKDYERWYKYRKTKYKYKNIWVSIIGYYVALPQKTDFIVLLVCNFNKQQLHIDYFMWSITELRYQGKWDGKAGGWGFRLKEVLCPGCVILLLWRF